MNYFISLVFWGIFYVLITLCKSFSSDEDVILAFFVIQIIVLITISIFLMTAVFQQFYFYKESMYYFNKIKYKRKDILILENKYKELKEFIIKYLGEKYPDYERDLINKIAESQPKQLKKFKQEYPELKTSESFQKLVKNITDCIDDIYQQKLELNNIQRVLDDLLNNKWFIWKPKLNIE